MDQFEKKREDILDFWNNRAQLLESAGSNDLIAKKMEIATIARRISDGMRILEIGCGNGVAAIELARRFDVIVEAIDFSGEMIEAAKELASAENLKGTITFYIGDIRALPKFPNKFDVIITERVLINLSGWEEQSKAIEDILACLNPGGHYLMCENSQDGLDAINNMREAIGLPKITPPWHNKYFREDDLDALRIPGAKLVDVECYSSTYYFLSRVVNAYLAALQGEEPAYDSPVNELALSLPPIGDFGQGKLWIWERNGK